MSSKSSTSTVDKDMVDIKEELVRFDNVKASYYIDKHRVTLTYTLGSAVPASPKDWIGLFPFQCQDTSHPFAFTCAAAKGKSKKKKKGGKDKRQIIFPLHDFNPAEKVTSNKSYQFVYVSRCDTILGRSKRFSIQGEELWNLDGDDDFSRLSPLSHSRGLTDDSDISILSPSQAAALDQCESPILLNYPSDDGEEDDDGFEVDEKDNVVGEDWDAIPKNSMMSSKEKKEESSWSDLSDIEILSMPPSRDDSDTTIKPHTSQADEYSARSNFPNNNPVDSIRLETKDTNKQKAATVDGINESRITENESAGRRENKAKTNHCQNLKNGTRSDELHVKKASGFERCGLSSVCQRDISQSIIEKLRFAVVENDKQSLDDDGGVGWIIEDEISSDDFEKMDMGNRKKSKKDKKKKKLIVELNNTVNNAEGVSKKEKVIAVTVKKKQTDYKGINTTPIDCQSTLDKVNEMTMVIAEKTIGKKSKQEKSCKTVTSANANNENSTESESICWERKSGVQKPSLNLTKKQEIASCHDIGSKSDRLEQQSQVHDNAKRCKNKTKGYSNKEREENAMKSTNDPGNKSQSTAKDIRKPRKADGVNDQSSDTMSSRESDNRKRSNAIAPVNIINGDTEKTKVYGMAKDKHDRPGISFEEAPVQVATVQSLSWGKEDSGNYLSTSVLACNKKNDVKKSLRNKNKKKKGTYLDPTKSQHVQIDEDEMREITSKGADQTNCLSDSDKRDNDVVAAGKMSNSENTNGEDKMNYGLVDKSHVTGEIIKRKTKTKYVECDVNTKSIDSKYRSHGSVPSSDVIKVDWKAVEIGLKTKKKAKMVSREEVEMKQSSTPTTDNKLISRMNTSIKIIGVSTTGQDKSFIEEDVLNNNVDDTNKWVVERNLTTEQKHNHSNSKDTGKMRKSNIKVTGDVVKINTGKEKNNMPGYHGHNQLDNQSDITSKPDKQFVQGSELTITVDEKAKKSTENRRGKQKDTIAVSKFESMETNGECSKKIKDKATPEAVMETDSINQQGHVSSRLTGCGGKMLNKRERKIARQLEKQHNGGTYKLYCGKRGIDSSVIENTTGIGEESSCRREQLKCDIYLRVDDESLGKAEVQTRIESSYNLDEDLMRLNQKYMRKMKDSKRAKLRARLKMKTCKKQQRVRARGQKLPETMDLECNGSGNKRAKSSSIGEHIPRCIENNCKDITEELLHVKQRKIWSLNSTNVMISDNLEDFPSLNLPPLVRTKLSQHGEVFDGQGLVNTIKSKTDNKGTSENVLSSKKKDNDDTKRINFIVNTLPAGIKTLDKSEASSSSNPNSTFISKLWACHTSGKGTDGDGRPHIPAYLLDVMDALPENPDTPNLRHWRKAIARKRGKLPGAAFQPKENEKSVKSKNGDMEIKTISKTSGIGALTTTGHKSLQEDEGKLLDIKTNHGHHLAASNGIIGGSMTYANVLKAPIADKSGILNTNTAVAVTRGLSSDLTVPTKENNEELTSAILRPIGHSLSMIRARRSIFSEQKNLTLAALETQCYMLDKADAKNKTVRIKLRSARALKMKRLLQKKLRQTRLNNRMRKEMRINSDMFNTALMSKLCACDDDDDDDDDDNDGRLNPIEKCKVPMNIGEIDMISWPLPNQDAGSITLTQFVGRSSSSRQKFSLKNDIVKTIRLSKEGRHKDMADVRSRPHIEIEELSHCSDKIDEKSRPGRAEVPNDQDNGWEDFVDEAETLRQREVSLETVLGHPSDHRKEKEWTENSLKTEVMNPLQMEHCWRAVCCTDLPKSLDQAHVIIQRLRSEVSDKARDVVKMENKVNNLRQSLKNETKKKVKANLKVIDVKRKYNSVKAARRAQRRKTEIVGPESLKSNQDKTEDTEKGLESDGEPPHKKRRLEEPKSMFGAQFPDTESTKLEPKVKMNGVLCQDVRIEDESSSGTSGIVSLYPDLRAELINLQKEVETLQLLSSSSPSSYSMYHQQTTDHMTGTSPRIERSRKSRDLNRQLIQGINCVTDYSPVVNDGSVLGIHHRSVMKVLGRPEDEEKGNDRVEASVGPLTSVASDCSNSVNSMLGKSETEYHLEWLDDYNTGGRQTTFDCQLLQQHCQNQKEQSSGKTKDTTLTYNDPKIMVPNQPQSLEIQTHVPFYNSSHQFVSEFQHPCHQQAAPQIHLPQNGHPLQTQPRPSIQPYQHIYHNAQQPSRRESHSAPRKVHPSKRPAIDYSSRSPTRAALLPTPTTPPTNATISAYHQDKPLDLSKASPNSHNSHPRFYSGNDFQEPTSNLRPVQNRPNSAEARCCHQPSQPLSESRRLNVNARYPPVSAMSRNHGFNRHQPYGVYKLPNDFYHSRPVVYNTNCGNYDDEFYNSHNLNGSHPGFAVQQDYHHSLNRQHHHQGERNNFHVYSGQSYYQQPVPSAHASDICPCHRQLQSGMIREPLEDSYCNPTVDVPLSLYPFPQPECQCSRGYPYDVSIDGSNAMIDRCRQRFRH